jgi:hypothetical protein
MRAVVRSLVIGDCHELGRRRRRVFHRPPRGWQAVSTLLETTYYPADYPAAAAVILVCPAVPIRPGLCRALLDAVLAGRALDQVLLDGPQRVDAQAGLVGLRWRLRRAGGGETTVVLLEDAAHVYAARLDLGADLGEARERFDELVATIEPIPTGRGLDAPAPVSSVMHHWGE